MTEDTLSEGFLSEVHRTLYGETGQADAWAALAILSERAVVLKREIDRATDAERPTLVKEFLTIMDAAIAVLGEKGLGEQANKVLLNREARTGPRRKIEVKVPAIDRTEWKEAYRKRLDRLGKGDP
jgi:hypothetical protein